MPKPWKICGLNFDHMHMGDLLRMAAAHPEARIVGLCDEHPERMTAAVQNLRLPPEAVFTDYRQCLETTRPDIVILCPNTREHADWVERVAPFGAHVLVEKPFAATLADADRMIAAMRPGHRLMINWPLRWVPAHVTAQRIIAQGLIGEVMEVHYYNGNRGPLRHGADKVEFAEPSSAEKRASWWYQRARGGGSLLDYLGYGVTLGAWFNGGKRPADVLCMTGGHPDLEVDEHSITVCRYPDGALSKFETRWGTFTDPWMQQPTPRCGFNIVGRRGTIASYDYADTVHVQTVGNPAGITYPAGSLRPPVQNPIQYLLYCLETGVEIDGPLSPAMSRIGQEIVDAAVRSVEQGRIVRLEA